MEACAVTLIVIQNKGILQRNHLIQKIKIKYNLNFANFVYVLFIKNIVIINSTAATSDNGEEFIHHIMCIFCAGALRVNILLGNATFIFMTGVKRYFNSVLEDWFIIQEPAVCSNSSVIERFVFFSQLMYEQRRTTPVDESVK